MHIIYLLIFSHLHKIFFVIIKDYNNWDKHIFLFFFIFNTNIQRTESELTPTISLLTVCNLILYTEYIGYQKRSKSRFLTDIRLKYIDQPSVHTN